MTSIILDNFPAVLCLALMFCSIALQMGHIKFKRKALDTMGKIKSIKSNKFLTLIDICFEFEGKNYIAKKYLFKHVNLEQEQEVEIQIQPKQLIIGDKSIVISWILKKFKIYQFFFPRVQLSSENPTIFYFFLVLGGLIIGAFI